MAFPTDLTNFVDHITVISAAHLNALEAKIGVDASAVTTSLDYLLKNPASINPGHRHSKLWTPDGETEAVTVAADGKFGIGTANPGAPLHVFGSMGYAITNGIAVGPDGDVGIAQGSDDQLVFLTGNKYITLDTEKFASAWSGFFMLSQTAGNSTAPVYALNADRDTGLGFAGNNIASLIAGGVNVLNANSSGNVGIGTESPNAAALLHLNSTTKGFLLPVMSTAQKNAISSPPAGLIVYDSDLDKLCVYTGSAWETITSTS